MKPLFLIALLLVAALLCLASIGSGAFNSALGASTPGSRAPVFATATRPVWTAPGASVPQAGATLPAQTVPGANAATTVPAQGQSQLPTTGAFGLPLGLDRLLPAGLRARFAPAAANTFQDAPAFVRILIPSIGVDAPVVASGAQTGLTRDGQKYLIWDIPQYAAGYHNTSAFPGLPGNTVISGHNNVGSQVFQRLDEMRIGEAIVLQMLDGRAYSYYVKQLLILPEDGQPDFVRAANARYIEPTGDARLTLVSCWPDWSNTERVVVVAMP